MLRKKKAPVKLVGRAEDMAYAAMYQNTDGRTNCKPTSGNRHEEKSKWQKSQLISRIWNPS